MQRLNELAVFPEDVSIPLQTVELLWQQTAALDEIDSEDLLQRLFRLSLLLDLDLAERTVRLHDVVRTWLRREVGAARLAELDGALVAGYRDRCGGAWHKLPDDGYALQHLPSHLRTADEAAWRELLLDPRWMARKLSRTRHHRAGGRLRDRGRGRPAPDRRCVAPVRPCARVVIRRSLPLSFAVAWAPVSSRRMPA